MSEAKDARTIIEKWRAELPHLVQPEAWMQPMIELLDAYDAMKQRAEAAEASCAVAWASMETMQGAIDTLTQQRDEAREERENVSSQLWDCMNEREGLRAERDEASVVTDAMVERASVALWDRYGDHIAAAVGDDDIRVMLTAALTQEGA
jgi:hypothetical protein